MDLSSLSQRAQRPSEENRTIESKQLAAIIAKLAHEKKAEDLRVYDVADFIKVADYFVVMTGTSRPHVKALFDELHVRLKAAGELHSKAEGVELGWWILMDYVDVVVHILQPEAREYYALDHLYQDCPQLDWQAVPTPELPAPRAAKLAE